MGCIIRRLSYNDNTGIAGDTVSTVIPQAAIYMPFAELVDIEKEVERRLRPRLPRKGKMEKYTQMIGQVKERLAQLKA